MDENRDRKQSRAEKLAIAILVIAVIGGIAFFLIVRFYPIVFARVIVLILSFVFTLAALAVPVWITYTIYKPSPRDPSMGRLMEGSAHFLGGLALVLFFGLMITAMGPMVMPGFLHVTKPMICPVGFEEIKSHITMRQYDYPQVLIGIGTTGTCTGELGDHEVSDGIKYLGGILAYLIYCGLYFAVVFVVRKQRLFALRPYAAQGIILAIFISLLSVTLLNPPVRAAIARPINSLLYRGHAVSLVEAVKRHKVEMIRDLLARGGDINAKTGSNETALETAQRYQDKEAIALFASRITGGSAAKQSLLDKGIVYSDKDFLEQVEAGNIENVRLFLEAGMDIDALVDPSRGTALSVAAVKGRRELVRYLLDRKADVNKPSKVGWTPLISAAFDSNRDYICRDDLLRLLLANGAEVNRTMRDGDTALTCAAQVRCLDAVKILLEHKADINARTKFGYSALLYAVEHVGDEHEKAIELVKYLLEHGADPNVNIYTGGNAGKTPLRFAKMRDAKKVVKLLEQYHARE